MDPELDPTQPGGQEPQPQLNPRNAAMAQIAKQAHDQQAGDLAEFDEEAGEVKGPVKQEVQEEVQTEVETEAQTDPVTEPEPQKPKMVSIIVDGQSIEVEESRLIEAGRRTLQKETAADKRLQEAERSRQEAQRLLEQASRAVSPDQITTPSQDASAQKTTEGLTPEALDTFLDQKLYVRDAQKARAQFEKEFPEIAADPDLMQMAAARENLRLQTAAALGESFGDPLEAYRKHGNDIREKLKAFKAPVAAPSTVAAKQEAKRSITSVSAVNAKAAAPQDKKPLSVQEQIEQMRVARTAGRPLRQTH